MNSYLKTLLNSLKCPICQSQIDVTSNRELTLKGFEFSCVAEVRHYAIKIDNDYIIIPKIISEIVNVCDDSHNYNIVRTTLCAQRYKTEITIHKMDPEGRIDFSVKNVPFVTELDLFDFQNFNATKAISRIKAVLVFQ